MGRAGTVGDGVPGAAVGAAVVGLPMGLAAVLGVGPTTVSVVVTAVGRDATVRTTGTSAGRMASATNPSAVRATRPCPGGRSVGQDTCGRCRVRPLRSL